ncbi:hypothetical protein GEMRC1_006151 [Eukaryota sp. GEM-RC1]
MQSIYLRCASLARSISSATVSKEYGLFLVTMTNGISYIIDFKNLFHCHVTGETVEDYTSCYFELPPLEHKSLFINNRLVSLLDVNYFILASFALDKLVKGMVTSVSLFDHPRVICLGTDCSADVYIVDYTGKVVGHTSEFWNFDIDYEYFLTSQRELLVSTLEAMSSINPDDYHSEYDDKVALSLTNPSLAKNRVSLRSLQSQSKSSVIQKPKKIVNKVRMNELSKPFKHKQTRILKGFGDFNDHKVNDLSKKIDELFKS